MSKNFTRSSSNIHKCFVLRSLFAEWGARAAVADASTPKDTRDSTIAIQITSA
jgi:hypothetical protein